MFEKISTYFNDWRSYRLAVYELSQLSDNELSDIGISRADITSVARRGNRR